MRPPVPLAFCLLSLLFLLTACAPDPVDHPEWRGHFTSAGCIIVYEPATDRSHRLNHERCARGFLPASTFKIIHALIALETGVAPDVDFVIPWDGKSRWLPAWNQDHSLRQAMRNSTVWYFQEIARRIGAERMREHLARAGYGNGDLSAGIDRFWLAGDFHVSPEAQVDFLRRLQSRRLPFARKHQDTVFEILVRETRAKMEVIGKTGLAVYPDQRKLGWWVGYARDHQQQRSVIFALNIAGSADEELMPFAAKREAIGWAVLADFFATTRPRSSD